MDTTTLKTLAHTYTGVSLPAISLDETLTRAAELMKERQIDHLPVILEDGTIVGLLSEKDIPRGERTSLHSASHVRDYMNWPIETLDESRSISEAAKLLLEKKISALLITSGDTIQGLVTTDDLLRAFVHDQEVSNSRSRTTELESAIYNSPVGSIAQVLADAGL